MRPLVLLLLAACASTPSTKGPTGPRNPDQVSDAILVGMANRSTPLQQFIDHERGLAYIDHFEGAARDTEEQPFQPVERLLCGAELDTELGRIEKLIVERVPDTVENGEIACGDEPDPTCRFGATMEWDPAYRLVFRIDPDRGAMLTAMTISDEVLVPDEMVAEEHARMGRRIAELTAKRCQ